MNDSFDKENFCHPSVHFMTTLCNPEPHSLDPVTRNTVWPDNGVKRSLSSVQISLGRRDKAGALEYSPEEVQAEIDGYADVVGDESLVVPTSGNRVEAIEEDDQAEEDQCRPGEVRLERSAEWQVAAADALGRAGLVEPDVRNVDANPRKQGTYGRQILKPREDGVGARRARHVGQESDRAGDQDAPDGDTGL